MTKPIRYHNRLLLGAMGLIIAFVLLAALAISVYRKAISAHYRGVGQENIAFSPSPDGKAMVFNAAGQGGSDLYLLDLRSSHVRQLTDTPDYEVSPRFSPDGRFIVYAAGQTGDRADHLFLRSVERRWVRQLTTGSSNDCSPSFSPDGIEIIFTRDWNYRWGGLAANWDGGGSLWIMRRDGTDLHRIGTAGLYAYEPSLIGHGRTMNVLYHDSRGVVTMPIDGSSLPKVIANGGQSAAASSDMRRIAFCKGVYSPDTQIYVAPISGGKTHPVASAPEGCFSPAFTSDGTHLFYFVESWPNGPTGEPKENLWQIAVDGTMPHQIASYHLFDDPLHWHP